MALPGVHRLSSTRLRIPSSRLVLPSRQHPSHHNNALHSRRLQRSHCCELFSPPPDAFGFHPVRCSWPNRAGGAAPSRARDRRPARLRRFCNVPSTTWSHRATRTLTPTVASPKLTGLAGGMCTGADACVRGGVDTGHLSHGEGSQCYPFPRAHPAHVRLNPPLPAREMTSSDRRACLVVVDLGAAP